jgi:hypothetical protein
MRASQLATVLVATLLAATAAMPAGVHKVHRVAHSITPGAAAPVGPHRYRAGSTVPVSGGVLTLGYYYISVEVGTPKTSYNLLLDTGSR